jgi:hypothetical protein
MKYVHLQCLQRWVKQRVTVTRTGRSVSASWQTLNCELCHTAYPFAVAFDGRVYELLTLPLPDPPYIVLESLSHENANGLHILSFATTPQLTIVPCSSSCLGTEPR